MKVLFLTNNEVTRPLYEWLSSRVEITKCDNLDFSGRYDLIISYNFRHIIPPEIVRRYKGRIINLHTSYLPWGRGANPLFWAVVKGEPVGVSIHFIDEGLDTGDVIAKDYINVRESISMRDLYDLAHEILQTLFKENWRLIKRIIGSYHSMSDFKKVKHILEPEGWDVSVEELRRKYDLYNSST